MLAELRARRTRPSVQQLGWRLRPPTATEFRRLAQLVEREAGITLNDTKHALIVRRLSSRIRDLGLATLGNYTDLVCADESRSELVTLLDLIATNETHFFREPQHFDYLENTVYPRWKEQARAGARLRYVRAWSAACSTGQEPYSLAMQFLTHLEKSDGWRHDILATDISTRALDVARAGDWPAERVMEIPQRYARRFIVTENRDRNPHIRATRELRDAIRFDRFNLNDSNSNVSGSFDLIFCRNVLIYFSAEGRKAVIDRLIAKLAPGGLLFVGHAESLHQHRDRLRPLLPTVYTHVA